MRNLQAGAQAVYEHVVRPEDTAGSWGNDVPVLATPVLLWLGEITAMRILEDALEDGEMSVGVQHSEAQHLAATPEGWPVTLTAVLTKTEGNMMTFSVEGRDAQEVVFRGTHVRAVIDRQRFLRRLGRKTQTGTAGKALA